MAGCGFQDKAEEYVLGLLDPVQRADFEAHLTQCADCRALVAAMAPLPGLMRHLHPDDTGSLRANELVADRVADHASAKEFRHPASRTRRRIAVIFAATLTAAAGLAAAVLATQGNPSTPAMGSRDTVTATDAVTGVSATATLTAEPTGTLLQMHLHGLPPGVTCRLVVTSRDGPPQTAADWTSAYTSDITVQGTSSSAPYDITRITVVTTQGQLLLTMPAP